MGDFTTIPILDLSLARTPTTKSQFLSELRDGLVRVGFFYLKNHPIPEEVQHDAMQQSREFFSLPLHKKLEIDVVHSKHFLVTSGRPARSPKRKSIVCGASNLIAPGPEQPAYLNLEGPSQWPDESDVPMFRAAIESYRSAVEKLSVEFTTLIEEALHLESGGVSRLFGDTPRNSLGVRNYVPPTGQASCQGIGAHKDDGVMTYLLQQGTHNCLEVQNKAGVWIPIPPLRGTLVLNIGRMLKVSTRGACTATIHRVVLKPDTFINSSGMPLGPRLSIAFFQDVNSRLEMSGLNVDIPSHIAELADGSKPISDADELFSGLVDNTTGDYHFFGYLTGFREVAEQWYPKLLSQAMSKHTELNAVR
ncbi:hypothetical protein BDW68DRAFT_180936 [Aspergillus falconensis]